MNQQSHHSHGNRCQKTDRQGTKYSRSLHRRLRLRYQGTGSLGAFHLSHYTHRAG